MKSVVSMASEANVASVVDGVSVASVDRMSNEVNVIIFSTSSEITVTSYDGW